MCRIYIEYWKQSLIVTFIPPAN